MKYNGEYEVDPSFVEEGTIKWRSTGNGEYIIATKGGKKLFIKRNMHVRYPSRDVPKVVYDKYKAEAAAIEGKQSELRNRMKGLDWHTDHLVVEERNFWDSEKMFTTVTPVIPDVLADTYDYTSLGLREFLQLASGTTKALQTLHERGVIHGDLKLKNILVTNKGKEYVPYIIDFDSAYPSDAIPNWESIGGSEGYQSPEVMLYGSDEGAAEKSTITPATDIFSLGVVFHKWWTNAFPGVDLEHGSVGAAVYTDRTVTINKKFNVRIGDNCGATLVSLINWMFAKKPADRPTAKQVVEVLGDKFEVPEAYHKGNDAKPFDTELWSVHKSIAELLSVSELKKLGVKSLKRINEGSGSASLKYNIILAGGTEEKLTISELCSAGYAKCKGAEIDEPWSEHMIEFEAPETISKKGYAKIAKVELAFRKRYLITTASGREFDKGYEWLISEGLAHPHFAEIDTDSPWPEHGTKYSIEAMSRLGVKSISRIEVGGQHRYKIVYNEMVGGKNKVNESVAANNVKLMGFIL